MPALAADLPVENLQKTLQKAFADVKAGNSATAYNDLLSREAQYAGQPQFDYLLGLAALESGNANYAVFALQRSISMDGRNVGAMLDLGRAYFVLGEYDESEKSFSDVLALNPPSNVTALIQRYLLGIKNKRDEASGSRFNTNAFVNVASGYDNNVNSAPTIDTYLNTPLNPSSQATPSTFLSTDIGAAGAYRLNSIESISAQAKYAMRNNWQASFVDNKTLNAMAGYQVSLENDLLSANATFMQSYLLDRVAGNNFGAIAQWQHSLNKTRRIATFAQLAALRNAPESASRDTNQATLGASFTMDPAKPGGWQNNLTVIGGLALPTHDNTPYGNTNVGVIASSSKHAMLGVPIISAFTAAFIHTSYDGSFPTDNGFEKRKDWLLSASGGPTFILSKAWQAGLSAAYTDSISNIPIYDFTRINIGASIRRSF